MQQGVWEFPLRDQTTNPACKGGNCHVEQLFELGAYDDISILFQKII